MLWLISYDVPDDRQRGKVAGVLETYGVRVQWSVFECRIEGGTLREIQTRLQGIIRPDDGANVRGYRICEHCAEQGWTIGTVMTPMGAEAYVIV